LLQDNWWCHKQYSSDVDMEKREWDHRHHLIKERILQSKADIVCIQEADGDTFEADFDFMNDAGYDHVLHRKFRFRCATFFQRDLFVLDNVAHKDRTLVTSLRSTAQQNEHDNILHIVNCHLSGGAAPERRLRQVHDGLDQIRKWRAAVERTLLQRRKGNRPSPRLIAEAEKALREYENGGLIVCGDFNSDGNTAVRKLLVEGCVEPDWHEPQYPNLRLTSKRKEQVFGPFTDAAELAYSGNVCDGDYGEGHALSGGGRPATYIVPNLASLLILPISEEEGPPRTEFGMQIAKGLAETLNLKDFCQTEIEGAFELADADGNGIIDQDEVMTLLGDVYVATSGEKIEQERNNFFRGFGKDNGVEELTKEQFITRLKALQQDREGERKAFGLARGLDLQKLSEVEMEQAFERIDLDGNGLLDEQEFQTLLEDVYLTIFGEEIEKQRTEFFAGFQKTGAGADSSELTREQFTERLLALHQELEGGRRGSELAEVRTEADVQKMIDRFTPLLHAALDEVFNKFSSNGDTLTQDEVNAFLVIANGELGRGGTFRHSSAMLEKKIESSQPAELTLDDWYAIFARELSEGKWWQVVHDLEVCGSNFSFRSHHHSNTNSRDEFYQGWLDYIYFQRLGCEGVQDALTTEERTRIYNDGDALPNEWHPSDHLPVSAVFSWK
jgi:endonuclease/exonuclease/phosphatase family metal-dependent hydrolase/Ca2+-binding EF-hand superfamily protein